MDTLNSLGPNVTPPRGVPSRFDSIPDELKALPQWVVWRAVERDGKISKPPFNPHCPYRGADVNDPQTWSTFEHALGVYRDNSTALGGIGYVFAEDDPFFGIDIDDIAKVKLEHLEQRRAIVAQLLDPANKTYTETSPSGNGLHVIGRGRLPIDGKRSTPLQIEVYGARRFFTMTGAVFDGRDMISDQQGLADAIAASLPSRSTSTGEAGDTEDLGRRLDLTDGEVLERAKKRRGSFEPQFNAQTDCGIGEWSDTFFTVICTLDEFSGDVEQIKRLVMDSPMVTKAPPAADGETRPHKAGRTFAKTLKRAREVNSDNNLYHREFGRQLWETFKRTDAERAKVAAENAIAADEAINSGKVWDAFPVLTDQHRELTRPPGRVGEFVEACEKATLTPFTKFAIPITLAVLAGIIGRGYKLPGGRGINLNFILAAESGSGKSQHIGAWRTFLLAANGMIYGSGGAQAKSRMIENGTASIQGIFKDFMDTPSCCWVVDECAAQLKAMSSPKPSPVEEQLRGAYNRLYDAAEHGHYFQPPRSIAGKKADFNPINGLAVSTFWTTTESKFDVTNGDAFDGFLSRIAVIRHDKTAGEPKRRADQLDAGLVQFLAGLLTAANHLDETYAYSSVEAGKQLKYVSTAAIDDLEWQMRQTLHKIKNAASTGELPHPYIAVARVLMTAKRIAAVLAVIENPYADWIAITEEQYLWAFAYVLRNTLELLEDMESGKIGDKVDDEWLCARTALVDLLKSNKEWREVGGVPLHKFRDKLKNQKTFKGRPPYSSDERVSKALKRFLGDDRLLIEIDGPKGKRGRPVTHIGLAEID